MAAKFKVGDIKKWQVFNGKRYYLRDKFPSKKDLGFLRLYADNYRLEGFDSKIIMSPSDKYWLIYTRKIEM